MKDEEVTPLALEGKTVLLVGVKPELTSTCYEPLLVLKRAVLATESSDAVNVLVVGKDGAKTEEVKAARKRNKSGDAVEIVKEKEFFKALRPTSAEAIELLKEGKRGLQTYAAYFEALPMGEYVTLSDGALTDTDLSGACLGPLQRMRLDGSRFVGTMFQDIIDCSLRGADLSKASLHGSIAGSDFSDASLCHARAWRVQQAVRAVFTNTRMNHAGFGDTDLVGVDLRGAVADEATFYKANLNDACLARASLVRANLTNASLANADLTDANLKEAILNGADLRGTNFTGANLEDAKLSRARYDEGTRFPDGFTPPKEMKKASSVAADHGEDDPLVQRLQRLADPVKLDKALSMLKADRFRLYAQVEQDSLVGVVKSQSDASLVYSCRLGADGGYSCCTQNLNVCGGLRGSLCKHLLVLIVGLAKSGELDAAAVARWVEASRTQKPVLDKDAMSETFLRYKGAEAGEVDWRPTETIPEDYYAM
jgi:uncharacterized protein YjbI with pentapeptide repeats